MIKSTRSLCDFIDASPTCFHAADNIREYLAAHGALPLDEREEWRLEPGVAYYLARGASSVIAFRTGLKTLGQSGYVMAGAHTDSPGLKTRPDSEKSARGMLRVPVDVYGGAILSGWLDRPLALAGRVILRDDVRLREVLYNSGKAIGVIPNLPIHLNRDINKGMEYNPHQHLPVLVDISGKTETEPVAASTWILRKIAGDMGVAVAAIIAADLFFYDCEKAFVFGREQEEGKADGATSPSGELINAPRLDDLAGCHAILEAFCVTQPHDHTQIACFLDAEEIGSMTAQGANSSFVRDILARINLAMKAPAEDYYRAGSRSLCISVDAAQAWNPAYTEKYDDKFSPLLGKGPAIKVNVNQRYATDILSESLFRVVSESASLPWQKYMARSDTQPGTTIGPISASRLGVRTMDIGHPLLSMHAVRETIHGADHHTMIEVLKSFFSEIPAY